MDTRTIKSYVKAICGVVLLILLDQVTKLLAFQYLNPENGGSDIVLLKGIFRLHYLENQGAAFGIMQGKKTILIITTAIVLFLVLWMYTRIPKERKFRYLQWVDMFIVAGAIGNFVDRIRLNYVIDMFYFELINFPVFNVADIYVTCSVVVFLLLFLFYYKEEELEWIWSFTKQKKEAD